MEPCPLCVFQRVALVALGIIFLIAGLHAAGRVGRILYAVLLAAVALSGIGVAGRHVWLQNLPKDQVPACGPGLDFMMDTFPFLEVLNMVLSGILAPENTMLRNCYLAPYLEQGTKIFRSIIKDDTVRKAFVQQMPAITAKAVERSVDGVRPFVPTEFPEETPAPVE